MLRIASVLIGLAFVSSTALADSAPPCASLQETTTFHNDFLKIGANNKPVGEWTVLSPAQYHFAEGLWVGLPNTPAGGPPGDSAALAAMHGAHGAGLVFMKHGAMCAIVTIPGSIVDMFSTIKTGPLDQATGDEM